ncbi:MAG: ABC transporter permease subunit [Myxococcales bacterium]|nr:ABC transporter permease subunit [Myxococcales bacterium]
MPPRSVHPATWLAAAVTLWLVALALELTRAGLGASLAEHEGRAIVQAFVVGSTLALAIALPSAVLAYPLARVVPVPWLVGLALVSPLARAHGVLALGTSPGLGASVLAGMGEAVPIAAAFVALVLRTRPLAWLEAAADLGASPWARFRQVEWPSVRIGVGVAAAWVGLRSLGDVVGPEVAGGGKVYGPGLLLRDAIGFDGAPGRAAVLVLVQLAVGLLLAWWATGREGVVVSVRRERGHLGVGRGLLVAALAGVLLSAVSIGGLLPALEPGWGRADGLLLERLPTTFGLAAITAGLAAVAALMAADPRAPSRATRALLFLPLALPPSVIGLGTLAVAANHGLGPSHALTVIALAPWSIALGFTTGWLMRGRVPARLLEAAADLGAGRRQRFARIRLPLAQPAAVAAAALAFAWVLADRAITGFTTPPGGGTVASGLAAIVHAGEWATAVRWSLLLALVPLGLAASAVVLGRRSTP